MKNPLNKIDPQAQYTPGIEGYVFDGRDESQMAFWTYSQHAISKTHSHKYDEYIVVVHGQYTVIIDNKKITLEPGDEYLIPKGILHSGEAISGTRAIYAFGGKRAARELKE
jgi:quercetin dioxygenase-like cupin family protein